MKTILRLIVLASVSVVLAVSPNKEAWIVNGKGRNVQVIRTDQATLVATIPLPAGASADPGSIAFSTLDGQQGSFAFVGQGHRLHVIDATTQTVSTTFNLSVELGGLQVSLVDLSSAPSREFTSGPVSSVESYLIAAADVIPSGSSLAEPYFIVLDQRVLVGATPGSPVVASGTLISPTIPPADRGAAAGVSALGSPSGDAFQRVWFSTRAGSTPAILRSVLLTTDSHLGSAWAVSRTVETTLGAGVAAPELGRIAVPHDREMPLLPTGRDGTLINLDTAGGCNIGGDLRQAAVAGPGIGGYQLAVIDGLTEQLHLVNGASCDKESYAVGQNPVDLSIDNTGRHGDIVVANQDSDDVSIVYEDGTIGSVALGAAPQGACVLCPAAVDTRKCCKGCTTKDLDVDTAGPDETSTWTNVGCSGCSIAVFCQCVVPNDVDCPCDCDPDALLLPGDPPCYANLPWDLGARVIVDGPPYGTGPDSDSPWIQLGLVAGSSFLHEDAGTKTLNYSVLTAEP